MKNSFIAVMTCFLLASPIFAQMKHSGSEVPAQSYQSGHQVKEEMMVGGYNHPAGINTKNWDLFVNVSFVYWEARQGAMSLGISNSLVTSSGFFNDRVIYQNHKYKPGFKVAAGCKSDDWDDWGGKIEYIRLHGSYSTSATAANLPEGRIFMQPWIQSAQGNGIRAIDFSSTWEMGLDIIDFGVFRAYYVGKNLTFSTFFGGRGGWLDQTLNFRNVTIPTSVLPGNVSLDNSSDSWFLGLLGSIDTNWILGWGLRLVGNVSVSLLHQKYDLLHFEPRIGGAVPITTTLDTSHVRPTTDMQWGLGWGIDAWNQTLHFDFEATYGFAVWWGQNMMRVLANNTNIAGGGQAGNLYLHGFTLSSQLNF